MKNSDLLSDLAKKLCDALPSSLQTLKNDMEKNFHAVLQNTFNKLDLVTRDEFDTQTKVLARTRKKIETLETEIKKLERLLEEKNQ
jgi:BMFP domain-containing protein YqiC